MLNIFSCAYLSFACFLWRGVQIFCLFLNWALCFLILSFGSSLCILDTNPLLDMCFAGIFSQSFACFFILLTASLVEQRFLILIKSNLPVFSFVDCAFTDMSQRFSAMLYSKHFLFLHFTFTL
uniref:Uncharacterized protein n=1 Tax=Balaenoptera musculus TaxID=9771 RepID=A0A8C0DCW9_BALMU